MAGLRHAAEFLIIPRGWSLAFFSAETAHSRLIRDTLVREKEILQRPPQVSGSHVSSGLGVPAKAFWQLSRWGRRPLHEAVIMVLSREEGKVKVSQGEKKPYLQKNITLFIW